MNEEKMNENAINPNNNNNKTSTFNLVIGIATLLIALLGATFAYFSATARSAENDVTVKSAYVSISYDGGTEVKATNLIPSSLTVAMNMYLKDVEEYDSTEDGEIDDDYDSYTGDTARRCVDSKGREVCYVYQFSIESDGSAGDTTDILAYIKVNTNEFENLSYLLYEVNFKEDENGNVLTDKYGINIIDANNISLVSSFSNYDTNSDNTSYTTTTFATFEVPEDTYGESGELTGTVYPVACLFGFSDTTNVTYDIDDTARCKTYSISNQVKHTYQLVIWLEETGEEQLEQGKTFEGTVTIEVSGGLDTSDYTDGKITGVE